MDTYELNIGTYRGYLKDELPDGEGSLLFKEDDERLEYEGSWSSGKRVGEGKMTFKSGDVYEGFFSENLPHGKGTFYYANGDIEEGNWDGGLRHGKSLYESVQEGSKEDLEFDKGIPQGTSKVRHTDGSEEIRTYRNGIKNGEARMSFPNGDTLEFIYVEDSIEGKAIYRSIEGLVDESTYKSGVKHGPSVEINEKGDREERNFQEGTLEGPAVLVGSNGDSLSFSYRRGLKHGAFTYTWEDGSMETGDFDEEGLHNGDTKMTWRNGSTREGRKKNGKWEGKVIYTHGRDTTMPGKRDLEIWEDGALLKAVKYYGEDLMVEDWGDLDKLVDHEKSGECPMKSLHR